MKKARNQDSSNAEGPVTFDTVRKLAANLPGAVESTSYGTPAFKVGKCLFVRQHQDGESLVVKIEPAHRAMRMKADPETFYITDHYLNYPAYAGAARNGYPRSSCASSLKTRGSSVLRKPNGPGRTQPGDTALCRCALLNPDPREKIVGMVLEWQPRLSQRDAYSGPL